MQRFAAELNLIHNPEIRAFSEAALLKAPAYWWTVTSSTSGKSHPPDERGPGGRVLHTKRVVRLVREMARVLALPERDSDILVASAIIHDLVVNGTGPDPLPRNWESHDVALRDYLGDLWNLLPAMDQQAILGACEGHMGQFGSQKAPLPGTYAHLLHLADVTASRSWVLIEPLTPP